MKKTKLFIVLALGLIFIIVAGLRINKYRQSLKYTAFPKNTEVLAIEVKKLNNAFKANDIKAIYELFNSSFKDETSFEEFREAFSAWLNQRRYVGMNIQNMRVVGRIGHVTCMLRFANKQQSFLYQSWIKTAQGWKIVWLNRLLPNEMLRYGDSQKYDVQLIKQRSLDVLFTDNLISLITDDLEFPKILFIQTQQERKQSYYKIPGYTIKELPEDRITAQAKKTDALFWLEFATIRIIDDVASIYIDIHPLYSNIPNLTRVRGIQLFFIQKDDHWEFDSPGSRW
ncbi:MAG: hypothetical protein KGZ86_00315 [Candidatus Latescibacteria bacterium]|nr:hypothetical protein [Candidatus Latescibacterota bacterium]